MTKTTVDVAIVGGGLAGGLIAHAIHAARPELRLALIEQGKVLGGNHRWSWFASDLDEAGKALLEPFRVTRWDDGYDVRFADHARTLTTPYRSMSSHDFHAALTRLLPASSIHLSASAETLDADGVTLQSGERIAASKVIDCRPFAPSEHLQGGWQIFLGRQTKLNAPHGLDRPTIMDADVEQNAPYGNGGAYRFVYSLPLSSNEIFVEDTYYADDPKLDRSALSGRIDAYCQSAGWDGEIMGNESGMLPVITSGDFSAYQRSVAIPGVAIAGARGGFMHPLTSYTVPIAVENALAIADQIDLTASGLANMVEHRAKRHWKATRFYRILGTMLFGAAEPHQRDRIFAQFYRRPQDLVERFYKAQSTRPDKLSILTGKPPVSVLRAIRALASKRKPLAMDHFRMTDAAETTVQSDLEALTKNSVAAGIDPILAERHAGQSACIIGSGFGGMALAIRLQSAGIQTTVIEARDKPGGRAYFWDKDGFTFDGGPTVVTDPDCLRELWKLTGHRMEHDVELMKVMPFYRLNWPDGTNFNYSNDQSELDDEIARLDAGDVAGYHDFLDYSAGVYEEGYVKLGHVPFLDFKSMLKAAPALAKKQAWRSVYSIISSFVKNEKLREALSFHTLLVGGNPFKTSAIYTLIHKLEKDGGVWWTRGGTNRLIAGMIRHFERLGGTMMLGDPVVQVHTVGTQATEVETQSGVKQRFDAVASNADIMHSYRDLLSGSKRGKDHAKSLAKKKFSPSLFVVHFGLEGTWPGIAHHTILFGPRYKGLLDDIYDHGVLPQDFSIYLHHPTVTDPSMAPKGKSTFYALVPVAHMGKLAVDWDEVGPVLEQRILDEIGRRLIPDIHDRIITKFSYAPADFANDLSAHLGSAFSLEPLLTQSAWFRGHNRDDVIENFYLVGAGTHPGAGIPGVVGSAKATAGLMLKDLAATKEG